MFNILGPLYTNLYTQRVTPDQQGLRLVTANPRMDQCGHRIKPGGEPPCLKKNRGTQIMMVRCAGCLGYLASSGMRAILGLPFFAPYGLVDLPNPVCFALVAPSSLS